jgi:hypothetical protein
MLARRFAVLARRTAPFSRFLRDPADAFRRVDCAARARFEPRREAGRCRLGRRAGFLGAMLFASAVAFKP